MIIDVHSHFWDAKQDLLPMVFEDIQRAGGITSAIEMTPESHTANTLGDAANSGADVVVVFGLRARNTGFIVSNDRVAEFVNADRNRRIGFASADPLHDADPLGEIRRCVEDLGMKGVKLGP